MKFLRKKRSGNFEIIEIPKNLDELNLLLYEFHSEKSLNSKIIKATYGKSQTYYGFNFITEIGKKFKIN